MTSFTIACTILLVAKPILNEPVSFETPPTAINSQLQEKYRTVEIVAPSISCFSRFRDSLKKEVGARHDWIRSVQVQGLGKRILKERPAFDFGNDVKISIEIESDVTVRKLAKTIYQTGLYTNTELWMMRSGHKMNDVRDRLFRDLLEIPQSGK